MREAEDADPTQQKANVVNNPLFVDGTFLYVATKMNQGEVVETLLSCGADPRGQNTRGVNAVDVATSEQLRQIYIEEPLHGWSFVSADSSSDEYELVG